MIYDERFGLVDRGTPGVHGGAVVRDIWAEREALDCMMRRAHNASIGDSWATDQRLMRLCAVAWGDQLGALRRERHEEWCDVQRGRCVDDSTRINPLASHFLRNGNAYRARKEMGRSCNAGLALLAPCYAVVADGERKRMERISGGAR